MLLTPRKNSLLTAVIAISMLIASCGGTEDHGSGNAQMRAAVISAPFYFKSVQIEHNGTISAGLPIRFESFDAPTLAQLSDQENLTDVVSAATNEFEQMLLLKDWVAAQWPAGNPNPYPPWNALDILEMIRGGVTGGFCAQYAQVLSQSLASFGLTARYVEIGSTSNPYAHFVMEAWSNQYNKWVMLDADYNLHFERSGIPLSALEIHDALVNSQMSDVVAIRGTFRQGHSNAENWPLRTAELYYYVRYHLKANHLSVPGENPFNRVDDAIEWNDAATVPWELSTVSSPYPKGRLTNLVTSDRGEAEGPLNQVILSIESQTDKEVVLRLDNNALGFARYQIRYSRSGATQGEWQDHEGSVLIWRPTHQNDVLEVRELNTKGTPGVISKAIAKFDFGKRL